MLTRDPVSYPMGYSIDWLPDGRLLTTGARLECQDGRLRQVAGDIQFPMACSSLLTAGR